MSPASSTNALDLVRPEGYVLGPWPCRELAPPVVANFNYVGSDPNQLPDLGPHSVDAVATPEGIMGSLPEGW